MADEKLDGTNVVRQLLGERHRVAHRPRNALPQGGGVSLAREARTPLTPGEAEKLARLVSEHHKAVQTEMEERFRRMEEELGLVPWPG